ncbi:MAG: AMP-dependent synthetase, partial [Pseudomonadota bacterium]
TPGYEGNPEANQKNFFEADGKRWFRTGDQGQFDDEGYLTLTGRLKEIINRGGEKISPLEVDGVLSAQPSIAQVVTFALPHPKLGEEVAAAVVLKDGESATEAEIREFASERLAAFKVPRRVFVLDEIPKGATGKLQRIGLAEQLGLTETA